MVMQLFASPDLTFDVPPDVSLVTRKSIEVWTNDLGLGGNLFTWIRVTYSDPWLIVVTDDHNITPSGTRLYDGDIFAGKMWTGIHMPLLVGFDSTKPGCLGGTGTILFTVVDRWGNAVKNQSGGTVTATITIDVPDAIAWRDSGLYISIRSLGISDEGETVIILDNSTDDIVVSQDLFVSKTVLSVADLPVSMNTDGVAVSSDGLKIAAFGDSSVWISSDFGNTWNEHNLSGIVPGYTIQGGSLPPTRGVEIRGNNFFFAAPGAWSDDSPPPGGSYWRMWLFRSLNGGVSWTKTTLNSDAPPLIYGQNLWVSSTGQNILVSYYDGTGRVFKSTDYGATFVELAGSPLASMEIIWSITATDDLSVIVVSGSFGGNGLMLRSSTEFVSESVLRTDIGVPSAVASTKDLGFIVVTPYGSPVCRSSDLGSTWKDIAAFSGDYLVVSSISGSALVVVGAKVYVGT